jgi:hypothetical protein
MCTPPGQLRFDISSTIALDNQANHELLGWQPIRPGLIADLKQGHYSDRIA